ncbi:MAG TPA: ATP-binding protein [Opitutaceae bacterium]|nr:ATP-binding protein [Opitutaceae bacterium]
MIAAAKAVAPADRFKLRVLLPLAGAIMLLLAVFLFSFRRHQARETARAAERSATQVGNLLREVQAQKTAVMTTTLLALRNDAGLGRAFAARDREAILARTAALFADLKQRHAVTHLYFHTPERVNFFRVHRPDQHGDAINRHTIREAERTGAVAAGIERGPIGTFVLRVVAPWPHDGRLIGYVELGTEFEDIVRAIHGLLQVDFVVAVHKQFLDRAQWDRALKSYGRQGSWDEYPGVVVMDKTLAAVPDPVRAILAGMGAAAPARGGEAVEADGRTLQLVFLPLHDVQDRVLGELVVVRDITTVEQEARAAMRGVALASAGLGAVLVAFFGVLLARVEKDLGERTIKLRREVAERQRAQEELRGAHEGLEKRVDERTAELRRANVELSAEIASRQRAQQELDQVHRKLVAASRQAGMAEVATGVLHNVGNVLNSVNVSATLVADTVRRSKATGVGKLRALLAEHQDNLPRFLGEDPRGRMVVPYLGTLADELSREQQGVLTELGHLRKNVDHIKDIVAMQQGYAKTSGLVEDVAIVDLVEDSLRMNAGSLARHDIEIVRDFQAHPVAAVDKHKVMQILVNLVRNAKQACDEAGRKEKRVTIRLTADERTVSIAVTDNGVGIAPENLTRIFGHGFTTRAEGHGFGLHSGALAAGEMHGSLSVASDGPGRGATFTLTLPRQSAPSS